MANGQILVDIAKEAIIQCFDLDRSALKDIDMKRLGDKYTSRSNFYKEKMLPHYRKMMYKGGKNYILDLEKEPFRSSTFEHYFVKTYYAICQILGEDCGLTQIPIYYMVMATKI